MITQSHRASNHNYGNTLDSQAVKYPAVKISPPSEKSQALKKGLVLRKHIIITNLTYHYLKINSIRSFIFGIKLQTILLRSIKHDSKQYSHDIKTIRKCHK